VFAAAVILDPGRPVRGLRDSKQLTPEERAKLAPRIRERALAWAVAAVEASEIDRVNIYEAARAAMLLAVEKIAPPPDYLLVDALRLDTVIPQKALIHGDARCRSIAAASILAKVARDESMEAWDAVCPGYGLARHKGYGTPEHLAALAALGPTPEHRRSFAPVRAACGLPPLPRNWFRRTDHADRQLLLFEEAAPAACR
jgi:ribonuclease HII